MFATCEATWKRVIVPFSSNPALRVMPYFQLNCRVIISYKLTRTRARCLCTTTLHGLRTRSLCHVDITFNIIIHPPTVPRRSFSILPILHSSIRRIIRAIPTFAVRTSERNYPELGRKLTAANSEGGSLAFETSAASGVYYSKASYTMLLHPLPPSSVSFLHPQIVPTAFGSFFRRDIERINSDAR